MDPIQNEPTGFQQTQTTRVKDPGPAENANPPPPPPKAAPVVINNNDNAPSPYPFRGQTLNTLA